MVTPELHPLRAALRSPISEHQPAGERLIDDPLFDFVDSQMMKVGSLAHGEVRWDEVESSIVTLMKSKTKDLKLLVHLLQCLQQTNTPERFVLSLHLLNDFMDSYWELCFPAPGARGVLPRKKYLTQILQRCETAIDKFCRASVFLSQDVQEALGGIKNRFEGLIVSFGLTSDGTQTFVQALERWLATCPSSPPEVKTPPVSSSPAPVVSTPAGSEKSVTQSLQSLADFLSENNESYPLGIRLRRHSVWRVITTPPDSNASGETLLRPMNPARLSEYQEQYQQRPDLVLWRKVEQSLLNVPFWFDGHCLSACIAQKLDKPDWAAAILDETRQFIQRLPELEGMRFNDGQPFVHEETRGWLFASEVTPPGSTGGDWAERRDSAFSLVKEGGLSVAMAMLNDGLQSAVELREQCYWRLLLADILKHQGLDAMAHQHYQSLYQIATQSTVKDWEPALIQQLTNIVITE